HKRIHAKMALKMQDFLPRHGTEHGQGDGIDLPDAGTQCGLVIMMHCVQVDGHALIPTGAVQPAPFRLAHRVCCAALTACQPASISSSEASVSALPSFSRLRSIALNRRMNFRFA